MMAEPGDFEIIAGVGNEVFYFFGIHPFSWNPLPKLIPQWWLSFVSWSYWRGHLHKWWVSSFSLFAKFDLASFPTRWSRWCSQWSWWSERQLVEPQRKPAVLKRWRFLHLVIQCLMSMALGKGGSDSILAAPTRRRGEMRFDCWYKLVVSHKQASRHDFLFRGAFSKKKRKKLVFWTNRRTPPPPRDLVQKKRKTNFNVYFAF